MKPSELYTYRVFYSAADGEYVAECAELPGLSVLEKDPAEALRGAREVAAVGVDMLAEAGDPIPQPLAARPYSGVFKVRIPSTVHRRLALEAAEQGVSLNRLVSAKLAGEIAEPFSSYGASPGKARGAKPIPAPRPKAKRPK
jgi:predicted HicB family RNase H-like nuclease